MYVQIDVDMRVTGYSSNKENETDIEIEDSVLDGIFEKCPIFYVYNSDSKIFEYKEELYEQYKQNKEGDKSPTEILMMEISKNKIALMQQQNVNKTLLEQSGKDKLTYMQQKELNKQVIEEAAKVKIDNMKQQELNKSLINEIANIKIANMKGGN